MGGFSTKNEDPYGDNELISLCRYGNYDKVEKLLENNLNNENNEKNNNYLNNKNNDGNSALMISIIKGHQNISKLLINKNIDLNIKNKWGDNSLILTCRCGQLEICRLIVSKGININIQNKKGETALMNSIIKGFKDISEFLFTSDNNLTITTRDGNILLHYLCEKDWIDLCQRFISFNSSSLPSTTLPASIPSSPALSRSSSLTTSILDHANQLGETPLHICCKSNAINCCEYLIQNGSNINLRTHSGDSPLMLACLNESFDIVTILLKSKSILNYQNNNGQTSLHILVEKKNSKITKYLLDYNQQNQFQLLDFNLRNNNGDTSLHLIVHHQLNEILQYIIKLYNEQQLQSQSQSNEDGDNKIDWNIQNHTGDTVLLIACKNKSIECIKLLLTVKQLNIKVRNKKEHNIYSFNKDGIYDEILKSRIQEFGEDEEYNDG